MLRLFRKTKKEIFIEQFLLEFGEQLNRNLGNELLRDLPSALRSFLALTKQNAKARIDMFLRQIDFAEIESLNPSHQQAVIAILANLYLNRTPAISFFVLAQNIKLMKKNRAGASFLPLVELTLSALRLNIELDRTTPFKTALALAIGNFTILDQVDTGMVLKISQLMQAKLNKIITGHGNERLAQRSLINYMLRTIYHLELQHQLKKKSDERKIYELTLMFGDVFYNEFQAINTLVQKELASKLLLARNHSNSYFSLLPVDIINMVGNHVDSTLIDRKSVQSLHEVKTVAENPESTIQQTM